MLNMLNSTKNEIYSAHSCKNANNLSIHTQKFVDLLYQLYQKSWRAVSKCAEAKPEMHVQRRTRDVHLHKCVQMSR